MRSTQSSNVVLPQDLADQIKARVASGEYASESDVIREGLRALQSRDEAIEQWLRNEVAAAYDAWTACPSDVMSLDDVRAAFAERHPSVTR